MKVFGFLKQGKRISVLIVPDGNDRTLGFTLSPAACKILFGAAFLCAVGVLTGAVTYWRVAQVALRADHLERENTLLRRENAKVVELRDTLYEMKEIDYRLKMMAGNRIGSDVYTSEEMTVSDWGDVRRTAPRVGQYPPVSVPATWIDGSDGAHATHSAREWLRTTPTLWPVQGWVTAEFTVVAGPFGRRHAGIDIAAPSGSPVKAAADGVVIFEGWTEDLGNLLMIQHDPHFSTRYGHNSKILVTEGEHVRRGQTVAFVGSSGRSSAPHLHFEIWKDGSPVNPREYLVR